MSTPSTLTVVYPPSFQNSFWSHPSYRPGAQSLYGQLQAGLDENESILAFVAHRAELEYSHAEALATPPPQPSFHAPLFKSATGKILAEVLPIDGGSTGPRGFAANASATSRAFRMLQAETNTAHANAHGKIARHLEKTILEPFAKWAADHRERVTHSWEHVDATLTRFERQKSEVDKLKHSYENKCRAADEAEDDARFAPIEDADVPISPPHSSDNSLRPPSSSRTLQTRSVSGDSTRSTGSEKSQDDETDPDKIKRRETIRKQFGFTQRATSATHSPNQPEIDGVKLPPLPTETEGEAMDSVSDMNASSSLRRASTISALVSSAVEKMPAPIKAAVGGIASAEPRHTRLRRDADNAEKVYEEAVRNLDRTRCQVEEVLFEHFGLAQRWEADRIRAVQSVLASYNQAIEVQLPIIHQSNARSFKIHQALDPMLELRSLIRQARTGPFHPAIERFQPYYHDEISLGRKPGSQGVAHGWLIKNGGFGLDLSLVERLEYLERLERQQSGTADASDADTSKLATLPPVFVALLAALERAYNDSERWESLAKLAIAPAEPKDGTGEDESKEHTAPDAKAVGQEKRKVWILEVPLPITHRLRDALIAHLNPSLADRIYGNGKGADADGSKVIPDKLLDSYDAPVLAACVKLWLLELEHSLITEDLWDQIHSIYHAAAGQEHEALAAAAAAATPTPQSTAQMGEDKKDADDTGVQKPPPPIAKRPELDEATKEKIRAGVLEDLRVVLSKLPKIHLACLDALFSHLCNLVTSTSSVESDAVYLNKLGLALGRALLRPKKEDAYTVSSQIGTLVVVDLLTHYEEIFPALVEKKIKEAAANPTANPNARGGPTSGFSGGVRPVPIRKRTKPVDQRISRSSIGSDLQQGARKLMEQMDEQQRFSTRASMQPPPVPIIPVEHREKAQPAPPAIITTPTEATASAKQADNAAAPTPLTERVLVTKPSKEAETMSITEEKAEESASLASPSSFTSAKEGSEDKKEQEDDDKPLSNVARLSRQFNSGNMGSNSSSSSSKRVSMGGPRGPRPAGARSVRMSGQFSSSSNGTAEDEKDKSDNRIENRRSWSRTMQPSDALVGDDEDEV